MISVSSRAAFASARSGSFTRSTAIVISEIERCGWNSLPDVEFARENGSANGPLRPSGVPAALQGAFSLVQ
jgi:hypothetical protein